jgi:hypothetical protein
MVHIYQIFLIADVSGNKYKKEKERKHPDI